MTHDTPASFVVQGFGQAPQHELLDAIEQSTRAACLDIAQRMLQQSLEAEVAAGIGERYAERTDGTIDWVCRVWVTQSSAVPAQRSLSPLSDRSAWDGGPAHATGALPVRRLR